VPGADTVAWRACRIADPRQAEVRAAPSYATQMNGLADERDLRLRLLRKSVIHSGYYRVLLERLDRP